MGWAIAAVALLVLLAVGLYVGFRDIPPNGRSAEGPPAGRQGIYVQAWKNVNDWFVRRKKIGR